MDLPKISEFDPSFKPVLPPFMKNVDLGLLVQEIEETHRKIREQMPKGPNYRMRSEAKRLKTLMALESTSTWSPKELAAAGFFFTGLSNSSQCFCCGLVLCKQSLTSTPMVKHKKFNPDCGFVQGKEVGNISKYEVRVQPLENIVNNGKDAMEIKENRLQSFSNWPMYAMVEPALLAEAGFFFKGRRDTVQCFCCGGCLGNWEENDDPWREHAKWFPTCAFLHSKKSEEEIKKYIQSYCGFQDVVGASFTSIFTNMTLQPEGKSSENIKYLAEIKTLNKQLIERYNNEAFYKISSFGDSLDLGLDLKSLFADIFFHVKDIRDQPLEQFTLTDILSDLEDITMIEGEAGSGKTALLRKIAILWASECCTILSRFSLVFYISLSSSDGQQTLTDIIRKQLIGPTSSLTEETLGGILRELKNKILFLVDDYGVMDSVPEAIEHLFLMNHANKLNFVVAVRTHMAKKLRKYSRTILSIQEFPLYSTIFLVKNLFSHDPELINAFFLELETSKYKQATLKTPLMTLAQCSYWFQFPESHKYCDKHILKSYLLYIILKFPNDTAKVNSLILSCGELAIRGLFQSHFDFTEDDLNEVGVDSNEALKFGLLTKFTAQRLRPVYRFCNPFFQEFLAGRWMSEHLESDTQEDVDKGLQYLKRVNTFLKIAGRYSYFMKYASGNSAKATLKILSYLFSLYDNKDAMDCQVESQEHLVRHPELEMQEKALILLLSQANNDESFRINMLLTIAVQAAAENQYLAECASEIKQFLAGKTISIAANSKFKTADNDDVHLFLEKYPESISLLSCLQYNISANKFHKPMDFSGLSEACENFGVPTVEEEYSTAYLSLNEFLQEYPKKLKDSNEMALLFPQEIQISDAHIHLFTSLKGYKVPVFILEVNDIYNLPQTDSEKTNILFSISDHIELKLKNSKGFVKSITPAIEQHLDSFKGFIIEDTYLSTEEQELLLKMSSLESLQITTTQTTQPPDLLIAGLHRFLHLSELSINLPKYPEVIDQIPEQFGKLDRMKKLELLGCDFASGSTRFVQFIKNFRDLESLNISFKRFPEFEGLMTSLSGCNKLKELDFSTSVLQEQELALLAATMNNLKSLKVLNLKNQKITSVDVSKTFALALGSLVHLQKLLLPVGDGMAQAAKLLIKQIQNLPNLQDLNMTYILDDESIEELGRASRDGYLKKLCQLELQMNTNVTESGWRIFFQMANNMPELNLLNIGRIYTYQVKTHATTVTSFVQFVSRLPSLVTIIMHGWLLDKDDFNMLDAMKKDHPQAKSLNIYWQWFLPFAPKIEG
ncbi:baculoviral IAP repeat-containing protein 1-like [Rhinophrynus dorsalis]